VWDECSVLVDCCGNVKSYSAMAALSWELKNQTVAATYGIGKSRAVATSRKDSFWISLA